MVKYNYAAWRLVGKVCSFIVLAYVLLFCSTYTYAVDSVGSQSRLPAKQAFILSMQKSGPSSVILLWKIAPGYHLYKDKVSVKILPGSDYKLGNIILPQGIKQHNDIMGDFQVYEKSFHVKVPLHRVGEKPGNLSLQVSYQGCYGIKYCYPPISKNIKTNMADSAAGSEVGLVKQNDASLPLQQQGYKKLFEHHNFLWILVSFFGFGLLLSFTPCVWPMIPILSSIIAGQKDISTRRAFMLSLIYVVSSALAFAVAGFITAFLGHSAQAFLQNKWVIIFVAALFFALALSLFGLYEIKMPDALQNKLESASRKQTGGAYLGVALMGAISSLVVSPCVSAPLMGALLYITTTGSVVIGGAALFMLGIGMGVPLLFIGTFGGRLFIQSGPWMNVIKIILGAVMVLMAVAMLYRLIPVNDKISSSHIVITSRQQLDKQLKIARAEKKPVVIDFYATWCVACKELAYKTFKNTKVSNAIKEFSVIRADVTDNNLETKALESRYGVYAPPAIIFINSDGKFNRSASLYGFVSPEVFMQSIKKIK